MGEQWRAVDLWQHMRWVVEDEQGAEVAACFGEHAQANAEQIVADHNDAASLQRQLDAERERRLVLEGVLQNIRMANGHLHGCWLVRGGTRCSPECVVVADALAAPAERRGGEVM
jgi:hypothetical protein